MKKFFLIFWILGLVAFGMVSCERDDDNGGTGNGNTPTNPTDTISTPTNPTDTTSTPTDTTATPVPDGYVDLGLPSGLLWTKCNLGATTPEGYGNYYAWGETQPKSVYTWETYTYGDCDSQTSTQTMYKYNTLESYGTVDNKTTLEAMDDAATVALGSGARIPTKAEWEELLDNTTAEWTTVNGVRGCKFTAANGNSLFLPAAGHRNGSSLYNVGADGLYWSSSLLESFPPFAWLVSFRSGYQVVDNGYRVYGRSVRAVRSRN